MSGMWTYLLSRSIWDHVGATVTMKEGVRKWRDRPAIAAGERVEILRFTIEAGRYDAPEMRYKVRSVESGAERWIDVTKVAEESLPEARAIRERAAS